jgi:aminoglycoside 6'-N-acetyltransferase I
MEIEALTEDDLDGCARPLVSAFNEEPWNEKWTTQTARKEILWTLNVPGFLGFVSGEGEPVGFAAGYRENADDGETFHLRTICVSPTVRGQGVGGELLRRLKETLTGTGVRSIYLLTDRGTPAEAFYAKHGYEASPKDIAMVHEW